MTKNTIDIIPSRLTDLDKVLLRGLCRQPWAKDREIAEGEKIKLSTVTASKNRMRRNNVIQKIYIPTYHRLGYPLISFSQLQMKPTKELNIKEILNATDGTVIPFIIVDTLNAFVMAYHSTYSDYKAFERKFEGPWMHDIQCLDGAKCMVNFDFTNTINKVFFSEEYNVNRQSKVNTALHKFKSKIQKRAFNGLIRNPEKFTNDLIKPLKITRQSIQKTKDSLKEQGIFDRKILVAVEKIGINLLSIIKIRRKSISDKDIFVINKTLRPFYYWVFDDIHIIITGDVNYNEL